MTWTGLSLRLAGRAVALSLQHRAVRTPITTTLETDEQGAIDLGSLAEIDTITATVGSRTRRSWGLGSEVDAPRIVHAVVGEPIHIPAPAGVRSSDLSLAELRGGARRSIGRETSPSIAVR